MKRKRNSARGQGLVEYALLIVLVAFLALGVLAVLALAINRGYGLVGGALGVRKDVQTVHNNIYFDDNPPQCGMTGSVASHSLMLYMQFFSDIDIPYLTATTEYSDITQDIMTNSGGSGIGNLKISYSIPAGMQCPRSVVIQSDPAHGSRTVVWNVLQKDWPLSP